jgi:hypothetical protein
VVNCQVGASDWERFGIHHQGDATVTIESLAFPGVFLRMDGSDVTQPEGAGAGTVNCQSGASTWERSRLTEQTDGTVQIASAAFPGVFLRLDGTGLTQPRAAGGGTANCQFGAGSWERFRLEEAAFL